MNKLSHSLIDSKILSFWLPLAAICFLIVRYYNYIISKAVNIPFLDDIFDFIFFINAATSADSVAGVARAMVAPYGEHFTAASRFVVYVAYLIEGEIDFSTLTIIANLAVLLILGLFALKIRGQKLAYIGILVAALLLLNLRSAQIILFSQCAFAYFFVFLYSFGTLYALQNVTLGRLLLAVLLAFLAMFTLASGLLVWVLGTVSLIHQALLNRRTSFSYLLVWLVVSLTAILAYRWFVLDSVTGWPDEVLAAIESKRQTFREMPAMDRVVSYLNFFFVLLGSAVSSTNTFVAATLGAVLFSILCYFSVSAFHQKDIYWELCSWFIVGSAVATTIGRVATHQPQSILIERYSFFSVLLLCTIWLLVLSKSRLGRSYLACMLVIPAAAFYFWSFATFGNQAKHYLEERFTYFNKNLYISIFLPQEQTEAIMERAITAGIYIPPCRPMPNCEPGN